LFANNLGQDARTGDDVVHRNVRRLLAQRGDPVLRGASSEIRSTVVVFVDHACPYSRSSAYEVLALVDQLEGVEIVFKEFPVLGKASLSAARASVAAARQRDWRTFYKTLSTATTGMSVEEAINISAREAGMDLARLLDNASTPETEAVVARAKRLAADLGVDSTPTFVVVGGGTGQIFRGESSFQELALATGVEI